LVIADNTEAFGNYLLKVKVLPRTTRTDIAAGAAVEFDVEIRFRNICNVISHLSGVDNSGIADPSLNVQKGNP